LLAASGVSTSAALRDLNNLNAQAGIAIAPPSNVVPDTDPETFVSNLQTQTTLDLIQQGLEQSKRDFDAFLEENVQMNWDAQRLKIYEHFGLAKPGGGPADDEPTPLGTSQRERGAFGRSSRRSRPLGASSAGMSFGPGGMTRSVLGNSTLRGSTHGAKFTDVPEKVVKSSSGNSLTSGLDNRLQRDKHEKYAAKIYSPTSPSLNGERNRESCFPVLHHFAEVEQSVGIDHTAALVNSYEALISITGESSDIKPASDPTAIKERQFAKQYLDETPSSAESIAIRKRILHGSRKCLESLYYRKVDDTAKKDPKTAQIGGMPTKTSTVRGYVRVLDSRKELGDTSFLSNIQASDGSNDYCWVILFTFLRCGLIQEAAEYVQQNINAFRSVDRKFPPYVLEYSRNPDRLLSREARNAINTEYTQSTKTAADGTVDPYRAACYKIVGRCELSRKVFDNINTDEEDWVWLQFALAREVSRSEEQAGEVFGLEQIRDTVNDIGKRHFSNPSDNPGGFGLFFFMRILAGQFEQAVGWLYHENHISAIHFAIALSYYGLLRVSDLSATELGKLLPCKKILRSKLISEVVSFTTRQQARVNFAIMLGYYTADFRAAHPVTAADYLCLVNLNSDLPGDAGLQQATACREGLRELVLETREFAALLGDLREDGNRIQGAIEQRANLIKIKDDFMAGKRKSQDGLFDSKKFMDELTIQAAVAADESGRTTDAVLLYHLASDFDAVLSIINRTLSEALTVPLEAEPVKIEATKPAADPQTAAAAEVRSTFSLATVDDPMELARNFVSMYSRNAVITRQLRDSTRESCEILMLLADAKRLLLESLSSRNPNPPPFTACLDRIRETHLLPLTARGDMNVLRTVSTNFARHPEVVARTIGDVILWAVQAVRCERRRLGGAAFEDEGRRGVERELEGVGRDLLVFAGMVKFRMSPRVFEALAGEGGDEF
jgi:nuclear pore complex protein Nup93